MIREKEPPRASVRISNLGDTATTVADARKTEARRLQELVRGDLDWVISKGLEKDRTRRYDSAANVAADIERYLRNEAVDAHPPSVSYRARNFALKNRVALTTVSLVILALCVGLGTAMQRNHVANQALLQVEQSAIELAKFSAGFGDTDGVETALAVIRNNDSRRQEVLQIEGLLYFTQGRLEPARERFMAALRVNSNDYFSQAYLAKTAINAGESAQFARELSKLDEMHPNDDYDRLLQASVFRDPFRTLELLDKMGSGTRGI